MNVRTTIGMGLVVANLAGWSMILMTRKPTSWAELESRRPRRTATGMTFDTNTAWGVPLFGLEVGGCFQENGVVSGFMLLNLPGLLAAMLVGSSLQMSPLKMSVISWLMGLSVMGVSTLQWYVVGRLVTRVLTSRTAPA